MDDQIIDQVVNEVMGDEAVPNVSGGQGESAPVVKDESAVPVVDESTEPSADDASTAQAADDSDKDGKGDKKPFKAPESQDELNRIIQDRVARERAKYDKFDEYKAAAERLKELEDSQKPAEQLADEKIAEIESKYQALQDELAAKEKALKAVELDNLRSKVAVDKGLPSAWVDRLRGETREDLEADAEALLAALPQSQSANSFRPTSNSGVVQIGDTDHFDPEKIVDQLRADSGL